ncbi:MAG: DUF4276 family protein [Saprospiraceae bacterium]
MVSIKIYIEGGGKGKYLEICFQRAWTKFFQSAGLSGQMPRPVRGKGRKQAYDLFVTALEKREKNVLPLLLVDSEDAITKGHTVWKHLQTRDGLEKPEKAGDKHAYLMVQLMETWLIADPEALHDYFGSRFKSNSIPVWTNLETVSKPDILNALDKATARCEKCYAKGKISFEVLGKISPEKVAEKCPHAKRFLDFLATNR